MLSFGLHNRRALGKIVGKFSEHKTVTSVLVRCEIAGNSKSFRGCCAADYFFFVRKRNHGEECLPKHKDPTVRSTFAKRRKLGVCILHLSYST